MITMFQVNIKCQPNSCHSNGKGNVIAVNQMNIQLMQLICTKVHSFQTCVLPCPSRDFSVVGKPFLIFRTFVVKIPLWNTGQLHWCFKTVFRIYLFSKSLWRWIFQPVGKAWPHFFGELSVSCFLMFLSRADKRFYLFQLICLRFPWKFPV